MSSPLKYQEIEDVPAGMKSGNERPPVNNRFDLDRPLRKQIMLKPTAEQKYLALSKQNRMIALI